MAELDQKIRTAAFDWLTRQVDYHGDVLDRKLLARGFEVDGERVYLISQQGIFKPRQLEIPLTITTSPHGPYDDSFGPDGFLRYRYQGNDPHHRDNRGLREAMLKEVPLIYFHGIVPGRYLVVWPVFIVGDQPESLTFKVAADDYYEATDSSASVAEDPAPRREYVTSTVRRRLHQQGFRERVLQAYRTQCALCRLRHSELLDAAHIVPDSDPLGVPEIRNGISMCKLHHTAFDRRVIGITPDHEIQVREDVLNEIDGPMLQHGFKEMHGQDLILPNSRADWPDSELLEIRFQAFKGLDRLGSV